ncbi:hypothetical protein SFUMM280S_07567 [Streptomyces fumanus]
MRLVQLGEDTTSSGPRTPCRGRGGLDDGDLGAVLAGRGGDLQADPPGAGDHQVAVVPAEGGEDALEAFGVGEAAQVVDAREAGAGDVEAAGFGAGGQEQLVVADAGAVVAVVHGPGGAVDGDDGLAEVEFHVVAGVPGGLVHEDAVAALLAEQEALGQRGPLVGVVALVTDQDHPAGETLRAEGLGRLAGQPSSDDDECLIGVDRLFASSSRFRHMRASRTEPVPGRGSGPIRSAARAVNGPRRR